MKTITKSAVFLCCLAAVLSSIAVAQSESIAKSVSVVPDSNNQVVKLTDSGISPNMLSMKLTDSIVFLLNDTADTLTTLEIDFGSKQMHCSGGNLRAESDGKSRSVRPFGPRDFASTCFHEPGDYSYTVYGLKPNPSGIRGTIHVE